MLIFDFHVIGNKLCLLRKNMGLTQAHVAEAAGISDRTYADIERGTVNMRVETLLRICTALRVTPDSVLTSQEEVTEEDIMRLLSSATDKERHTALKLLESYLANQ